MIWIAGLRFLVLQIGLGLRHLGSGLQFGVRVERRLGLPLLRLNARQQLAALDRVALLDQELLQAALDLRADDDLVGRDDAGEHDDLPRPLHCVIEARRRPKAQHHKEDQQPAFLHGRAESGASFVREGRRSRVW